MSQTIRRPRMVDPGFRLPTVPNVQDYQCIRAWIPRDSHYAAAFWSQYEALTQWLAWEREETKSGAVAASVWKNCFDMSREDYDNQRGCDYQVDYGDDATGKEQLADYLWHWYDILTQAAEFNNDGKTRVQWLAYVTDTYHVYYAHLLDDVWDEIASMIYDDAIDEIDDIPWEDAYSGWCQYQSECKNVPFWDIPWCYISKIIDAIFDTFQQVGGGIAGTLGDAINSIFSGGGMGDIGDWPVVEAAAGLGDNFNFGEIVCTWEQFFDFEVSESGWVASDFIGLVGGGTSGAYSSGVGWIHTDVTELGDWKARDCCIEIETDEETVITRIECTIDYGHGTFDLNAYAYYAATDLYNIHSAIYHNALPAVESTQGVDLYDSTTTIRIALRASYGHLDGSVLIKSVRLFGEGINPWMT